MMSAWSAIPETNYFIFELEYKYKEVTQSKPYIQNKQCLRFGGMECMEHDDCQSVPKPV